MFDRVDVFKVNNNEHVLVIECVNPSVNLTDALHEAVHDFETTYQEYLMNGDSIHLSFRLSDEHNTYRTFSSPEAFKAYVNGVEDHRMHQGMTS